MILLVGLLSAEFGRQAISAPTEAELIAEIEREKRWIAEPR
ncbi:MAG: hypothetical protein ACI8WM_000634 [Burkholderiaceae bacterium]|jgi:hypothetical protein